MKKLLIAMAVAGAAICSQAAMATWSVSDGAADNATKDPPWTYFTDAKNISGMTAYLVLSSDWDATSAETIATSLAKAVDSKAVSTWSKNTWDTVNKKAQFQTGNLYASSDKLTGTSADFYVVLADTPLTEYWATEIKGVTIYTDPTTTGTTNAKVQLSNATALKPGDFTSVGGDTPEPTSGLLLLLGVAGLALRRKNA